MSIFIGNNAIPQKYVNVKSQTKWRVNDNLEITQCHNEISFTNEPISPWVKMVDDIDTLTNGINCGVELATSPYFQGGERKLMMCSTVNHTIHLKFLVPFVSTHVIICKAIPIPIFLQT